MNRKGQSVVYTVFIMIFLLISTGVVIYCMMVGKNRDKSRKFLTSKTDELAKVVAEQKEINAEVEGLKNDPKVISRVARERFNLCEEGEIILKEKKNKQE
ncbi:septum formation initiator family protein [Lentisphaerota bacterium WC36G]|nr:septum formation initiator family protein [Lentisphaerae bacterium WC36]